MNTKQENNRRAQADFKKRMRDKGFVTFNAWIKPEWRERLNAVIDDLSKKDPPI